MIDTLYLLFKLNKDNNLEDEIDRAIIRWHQKPELKEYFPEAVVFNPNLEDEIKDEYILTLKVKFDILVAKDHFNIEGVKYDSPF